MRIDRRRLVLALAVCPFIGQAEPLIMNYDAPASVWNEALPLGNGRIGVMVFGAPGMERLELNEETYWAGSPHNAIVNGLKPLIDEARRKILQAMRMAPMKRSSRNPAIALRDSIRPCRTFRLRHFASSLRVTISLHATGDHYRYRRPYQRPNTKYPAPSIDANRSRRLPMTS